MVILLERTFAAVYAKLLLLVEKILNPLSKPRCTVATLSHLDPRPAQLFDDDPLLFS